MEAKLSPTGSKLLIVVLFAGASFFSYNLTDDPIKTTISDATIAIVMGVYLFRTRTIELNRLTYAFGALAGASFLSGGYNLITDDEFALINFSVHFLRLLGMIAALMVLPKLIRDNDDDFTVRALAVIITVHIVAVIANHLEILPFPANSSTYIVAGFFQEPGWFGIWVFLALALIAQHEWNTGRAKVPMVLLPLYLASSLLVRSGHEYAPVRASVSPIVLITLATITMTALRFRNRFLRSIDQRFQSALLVGASVGMVVLIVMSVWLIPVFFGRSSGIGSTVVSLQNRVSATLRSPTDDSTKDASIQLRVFGSWEIAGKSYSDSPVFGTGLGGENLNRTYAKHEATLKHLFLFGDTGIAQVPAEILRATGLLGFIILLGIYTLLVIRYRWMIVGGSLIVVGAFWGDPFSSALWPFFAACAALMAPVKEIRIGSLKT